MVFFNALFLLGMGKKNPNRTDSNRTNRNENDSNQTKLIMVYFGWKKNSRNELTKPNRIYKITEVPLLKLIIFILGSKIII